jgi:hypothetical protein
MSAPCEICGKHHGDPPPEVTKAIEALILAVESDTHDRFTTARRLLELFAGYFSGATDRSAISYLQQADLPSEKRFQVKKTPLQENVGLYFTADDVPPGEIREVKAEVEDLTNVPLFKLHKVWKGEGGTWWLHDIKTDKGSQLPPGSKGYVFESTPPLSSGTTMNTCDPRSIVLVVENKGTELATFKAALLGVKARRP